MDRGAWRATFNGIAKSWMTEHIHTHAHTHTSIHFRQNQSWGDCKISREPSSLIEWGWGWRQIEPIPVVLIFECTHEPWGVSVNVLVTELCLTLCSPMDCSPPGSSVHGILQAELLECVAIPFSRGSSWLRDWTWVSCHCRQILYHLAQTVKNPAEPCPENRFWFTGSEMGPQILPSSQLQESLLLLVPGPLSE